MAYLWLVFWGLVLHSFLKEMTKMGIIIRSTFEEFDQNPNLWALTFLYMLK